jgi:hypothetical protein
LATICPPTVDKAAAVYTPFVWFVWHALLQIPGKSQARASPQDATWQRLTAPLAYTDFSLSGCDPAANLAVELAAFDQGFVLPGVTQLESQIRQITQVFAVTWMRH